MLPSNAELGFFEGGCLALLGCVAVQRMVGGPAIKVRLESFVIGPSEINNNSSGPPNSLADSPIKFASRKCSKR
jgi:hypothetical protein